MLIGREREQAAAAALLGSARTGAGGAIVFTGEPGIGKTALLHSVTEAAKGFTVVSTQGIESESDLPFAALSDLLRPLERHFGKLPAPQEQLLRAALAVGEPMNGDRLAIGVGALGVFAAAARRRPVLVVLDDLHWLDSESGLTVAFLARRLSGTRIALVGAARPSASALELPSLALAPLADPEAEQVIRATATSALPSALVRRVVALAAGNPLALVELPSVLGSEKPAGRASFDEPLAVSASIERAFCARVDELPGETRKALLLAAASGGVAAIVRQAMAGAGVAPDALDSAEQAALIVLEGSRLRFRHPLVGSVVYQRASAADRRAAHRALADAEMDDDRRAWHLAAAATAPDDVAADAVETAATRALRRGAAASAARAFERAAELSSEPAERGRRLALAARAAHRAGDLGLTARLAAAARELADDRLRRADLLILESDLRMRRGDYHGAHGALAAGADELAEHDRRRAATMLLLASKLHVYRLEAADGLHAVERALELYPAAEQDAVHLTALAMTRTMVGHPGAARAAHAAAAAARDARHGHMHTLGIAWPLIWLEEYQPAREVVGRAVAVQREGGILAYLPQALLALAELDFRTGRWAHAEASALEALSLFHETEQPTEAAVAAATLARLEAARGNDVECRRHASAAIASDLASGLRVATAFGAAALGQLALASGAAESAVEPLRETLAVLAAGGVGHPWLLPVHADLVDAYVHVGDLAAATEAADELERQALRSASWSARAVAARCRGLLAAEAELESLFERALELHAGQPTPFERARTELSYGKRLRRARRRRDARLHLQSALDLFEALGATRWAERARTELLASGERRRPDAASSRALTAHEREVVRLVIQGATNREAATSLFVSQKTIEFHLGNVYRKLGVRSRTELVRAIAPGDGSA